MSEATLNRRKAVDNTAQSDAPNIRQQLSEDEIASRFATIPTTTELARATSHSRPVHVSAPDVDCELANDTDPSSGLRLIVKQKRALSARPSPIPRATRHALRVAAEVSTLVDGIVRDDGRSSAALTRAAINHAVTRLCSAARHVERVANEATEHQRRLLSSEIEPLKLAFDATIELLIRWSSVFGQPHKRLRRAAARSIQRNKHARGHGRLRCTDVAAFILVA